MTAITDPAQMSSKPLRASRQRRRKSPNGAGGVYFNQSTGRWMGHYTTDDPETGFSVRKAVYGHTEQEARAKLIEALAARQAGSLLVRRGRELTVGQYAEHWLAGLRKRPTTRARYRQAIAHVIGDDRLGNLPLTRLRPQHVKGGELTPNAGSPGRAPAEAAERLREGGILGAPPRVSPAGVGGGSAADPAHLLARHGREGPPQT
jgi:hypothetical protein